MGNNRINFDSDTTGEMSFHNRRKKVSFNSFYRKSLEFFFFFGFPKKIFQAGLTRRRES